MNPNKQQHQSGAVLVVSLLILLVVTMLGIAGMDFSTKSIKVAESTVRVHELYYQAEAIVDYSIKQSSHRNHAMLETYKQSKGYDPTWDVHETNAAESDRKYKDQSVMKGDYFHVMGSSMGIVKFTALDVRSLATHINSGIKKSHLQGYYYYSPASGEN
jgi:hypothetical protein